MKPFLIAAALCLLSGPALAQAQIPAYINNRPVLPTAPGSGDRILITRGSNGYYLPGGYFIPYSAVPDCPDTGGQHLNFTGGTLSCGTSGGTVVVAGSDCLLVSGTTCVGVNSTTDLAYH